MPIFDMVCVVVFNYFDLVLVYNCNSLCFVNFGDPPKQIGSRSATSTIYVQDLPKGKFHQVLTCMSEAELWRNGVKRCVIRSIELNSF